MSRKIYVGNLGYDITNETLSEKFSEFGNVDSAKVIVDRDTNRSKGFAFVEMSTVEEAQGAIKGLNGTEFGGRQMNVTEAKPQAPRENSSRGGFGGGGGGGRNRY
ncbi:MAG: RNA-binding protein [Bdellovibrionales bacterium GWA2_49_15]|nr:MAG: RNA-binding protein [Bdellovibrionales bacterium GWA2_49_15]HAZ13132.1 RNA-binding protein [Bdellovibrionales bacterium]